MIVTGAEGVTLKQVLSEALLFADEKEHPQLGHLHLHVDPAEHEAWVEATDRYVWARLQLGVLEWPEDTVDALLPGSQVKALVRLLAKREEQAVRVQADSWGPSAEVRLNGYGPVPCWQGAALLALAEEDPILSYPRMGNLWDRFHPTDTTQLRVGRALRTLGKLQRPYLDLVLGGNDRMASFTAPGLDGLLMPMVGGAR